MTSKSFFQSALVRVATVAAISGIAVAVITTWGKTAPEPDTTQRAAAPHVNISVNPTFRVAPEIHVSPKIDVAITAPPSPPQQTRPIARSAPPRAVAKAEATEAKAVSSQPQRLPGLPVTGFSRIEGDYIPVRFLEKVD